MKQQILTLGKDSMIYGVGSVITRFIGLLMLPLFTAYLTPEEYGVLAMLAILTMVAQPVFSLGLSAAMGPSYFEGNNADKKSKAVWTVFVINLVSASLLLLVAWMFPGTLGQLVRLPEEYAFLVGLNLTGCALTVLVTPFILRVQFEKQAHLYVLVTVATALTAILVSVITVVFLEWGVKGMVVGQLVGNSITFFAFMLVALKATKPCLCLAMARELLRLGLPLIPGFAFLFVLMHANKFILEWQGGLDAVGIYSIGFNLGVAISIVTSGFTTAWYPFFMTYMERQDEARTIFGRVFTYYTFGIGLLALFFFVWAKPVVMLLTNEAFHQAYLVVGLVASAHYFMGMYNLLLPGMYFRKEVSIQSAIQGCAVLVSFPLMLLFVSKFGVLGAALGAALGCSLMALFTYFWNLYRRKSYVIIDYEWGRVGCFAVVYVLTALFFLVVDRTSLTENLIISSVGALAVIFIVIQLLRDSEVAKVPYLKYLKV